MAECKINYIESQPFSNAEKERLSLIHQDIFKRAKDSKAFRAFDDRLFTLKNAYNKATTFIAGINDEYTAPITKVETVAPGQHVLNVNVLPLANEQQEVLFQLEPHSVASPEKLKKVKEVLDKMGVEQLVLFENNVAGRLGVKTVNAMTILEDRVIALSEGKEDVALTEEMVHIATSMIEQVNPKMITEMISKIDRFKIYKETYEQYKGVYLLPNGKPDIRKIKKEAVDKLISEVIINSNENIDQYPELREELNQSLVRKWWQDILDFINGLYKKANIDIFEDVASKIIEGNFTEEELNAQLPEGEFYQLSDKQKGIQEKLAATKNKIEKVVETTKADPLLLDSEEANNFYRVKKDDGTWEKVLHRVTDRVKSWYKERFGNKTFSETEKVFNELKRKYGVQGHADLEEIHSRYYNEDGSKRAKPLARPSKFNLPSQKMYDILEKYFVDLVTSFDKDSIVLSETILYDTKAKEAGTIDLLIIEPSGKTNIFDWKFMSVGPNQEDVAWYKKGAYNLQIGRYKDILRDQYGAKEFGQLRAIPILMDLQPINKKDKDSAKELKGIAIGTVDTSKIKTLLLLPIAEETESTGYEALDAIIKKLNAYLKQVTKEKTTTEDERQFKLERLNTLEKAIRLAHVQQNVVPLIDVIEVMRKEGDRILEDYNVSYKDRPATSEDSEDEDLSDFSNDMRDYIKLSAVFTDIGDELGNLIYEDSMKKEAKTAEEKADLESRKKFLDKLNEESRLIRISQKQIKKAAFAFADKHVGQRNLVAGLLKPEKVVKGLGSIFRGVSELPLKSLEILHKLTRAAQGRASEAALKEINSLTEIRKKLEAKGGDIRKMVLQLYQKDTEGGLVNKLIYKYQKAFSEGVDKMAENGGSITWLKDNIDVLAYQAEAKQVIDRQIEYIKKTRYKGNEQEEDTIRQAEILKVKKQYDIGRADFNGWNNYVIKRHPLDKWYSEEYKNVLKDEDLLALYNFIVGVNEKAKDTGYIANNVAKTFLPFIRKTMAEQIAFDNNLSVMGKLADQLQIKAETVGYGNINEVTGELENSIPKYYTHDFSKTEDGVNDYSDVSMDLFKNLILYIQQLEKYKYMTEIEGQLKLVKTIEEFKGHLNTGRTGDVVVKDGKVEELPGNAENTKLFDDFLRVLLYEQKYVLSDTDTPLNVGKIVNFVKNSVNKVAGKEVWKVDENPSPTSLHKTIDAANRAFQLKTLGFEFISGAVNFFGGNLQAITQAGNYFKTGEFAKNQAKLIAQNFSSEEEKKIFAELVNTFMPLKDDPAYEIYKQAGMSKLTQGSLSDTLFVFMRKPEQLIEKAIFLSLLQNTMVVDGKIVSIPEYVKAQYKDRYNSSARYAEVQGKIDAEIEQLKKTKSIAVTRKLENGQLVIPGLDLSNRTELQRLTNLSRRISRNATGGMTDGDINKMSMNVWTKSMMVFKGWIPKLADTRFSEFRKVSDDFSVTIDENGIAEGQKYDIGRLRLLLYVLSDGFTKGAQNLYNIVQLNQAGLNRLDDLFEEFKKKYETETGETLNMSREAFIDLIRTNIQNQLKELAILASLLGMSLALGFVAPEDDDDKAAKNAHRYAQRVVDKFVSEISFFYNPAELESILSGGAFPAIGLVKDFEKFISHFFMEITGMDLDPATSFEDTRKKAKPIKYAMKMFPVTKSLVTYLAIFSDEFARDFDVTIQKETRR